MDTGLSLLEFTYLEWFYITSMTDDLPLLLLFLLPTSYPNLLVLLLVVINISSSTVPAPQITKPRHPQASVLL